MKIANQSETWYCGDAVMETITTVEIKRFDANVNLVQLPQQRHRFILKTDQTRGVFYRPTFEEARQAVIDWYGDKIVEFTNAIARIKELES